MLIDDADEVSVDEAVRSEMKRKGARDALMLRR